MQEFEYRLEKEDYKNWIHWNVLKHESKKMKMVSALLYVAFLALFLGKNVMQAKGNLVLLVPVSYTQLDVYKRQRCACSAVASRQKCACVS